MCLCVTESDWLLLGSPHCVESPVEVRQEGPVLGVRGQIKAQHYWHTGVLFHKTGHGFLSLLISSLIADSNGAEEDEKLFSVNTEFKKCEREERRPFGIFWDAVLSQMDLQAWGKLTHMLKNGSSSEQRDESGLEPIQPQMNTHIHTTHREREDSHMEIQRYLLYFKIILFFSLGS